MIRELLFLVFLNMYHPKLGQTCVHGDLSRVCDLVKAGADLHLPDHGGWTPLQDAISAGRDNIVQFLLSQPTIQVNQITERKSINDTRTALLVSASFFNTTAARLLLDHKADVLYTSRNETNLLHLLADAVRYTGLYTSSCLDFFHLVMKQGAGPCLFEYSRNGGRPVDVLVPSSTDQGQRLREAMLKAMKDTRPIYRAHVDAVISVSALVDMIVQYIG